MRLKVLNERIKQLRVERGLSQVDLAMRLGVSKQSISNWENDNIQPSIEMLLKLSHVFSVSTDYLLSDNTRCFLEITGLDSVCVSHIQMIIDDMKSLQS